MCKLQPIVYFYLCIYWPNGISQESFEIPRDQASREGDIELGERALQNSGELGLENFFKKVALICFLFTCARKISMLLISFSFYCFFLSFIFYFSVCGTWVSFCALSIFRLTASNYAPVSFFFQVQEIEKQNDKLNVQLKKLQVSFSYVFMLLIILWAANLPSLFR